MAHAHAGMKCPDCSGNMFLGVFYDFFQTFKAWKCIQCSRLMDTIILINKTPEGMRIADIEATKKAKSTNR